MIRRRLLKGEVIFKFDKKKIANILMNIVETKNRS
jgi:hypothetical protein